MPPAISPQHPGHIPTQVRPTTRSVRPIRRTSSTMSGSVCSKASGGTTRRTAPSAVAAPRPNAAPRSSTIAAGSGSPAGTSSRGSRPRGDGGPRPPVWGRSSAHRRGGADQSPDIRLRTKPDDTCETSISRTSRIRFTTRDGMRWKGTSEMSASSAARRTARRGRRVEERHTAQIRHHFAAALHHHRFEQPARATRRPPRRARP